MANDGEVYGGKAANSDEVQSAFPPVDRHAYPNNMTVIARITQGGQPVSGAEIGVFADDEKVASIDVVFTGEQLKNGVKLRKGKKDRKSVV